jgi:hypothetical protein
MGFFSPGFIIGAASSLTNQIEDAKERNAEMMERRRDQFDQLSREAKRELNRKKMTEQEYIDLAKEVLSPELKIHIGDDPALLAAAGKSFKIQSQTRGLTPTNFNKSIFLNGLTEEGTFDPTKVFNIKELPKMGVEEQTEEGVLGRVFRGITGAPSQQELAETDPSRLTTDIREASVNLDRIYNPLDFDDSAWNKAYKSFADTERIELGVTPTGQYSLENLLKADEDVRQKLKIINTLRQYQAYTEDDIGGITGHVKSIYEKVKNLGNKFDTVVTQIAKDMNETSVSEVMGRLDEYVTTADGGKTSATSAQQQGATGGGNAPSSTPGRGGVGRGTSGDEPVSESSSQDLAKILKEQVPEDAIPVGETEEGDPIFKVVINGADRLVANRFGSPYIVE